MKSTTNNAPARIGKELITLNTLLYENKLVNITYGIAEDPALYTDNDLHNMWWPYGRK